MADVVQRAVQSAVAAGPGEINMMYYRVCAPSPQVAQEALVEDMPGLLDALDAR